MSYVLYSSLTYTRRRSKEDRVMQNDKRHRQQCKEPGVSFKEAGGRKDTAILLSCGMFPVLLSCHTLLIVGRLVVHLGKLFQTNHKRYNEVQMVIAGPDREAQSDNRNYN